MPLTADGARSARGGGWEDLSTRGDGRGGGGLARMAVSSHGVRFRYPWPAMVSASDCFCV